MLNHFNILAPIYDRLAFGAKRTFRKLTSLTEFKISDHVLDIGGGTGRIARLFVGRVKEITVIDPSAGMIKQCQKRDGIVCLVGNGEGLPLPDNSVDKVIMIDVFHHIQNQQAAIAEIRRVLKQNGEVILEEFDPAVFGGGEWLPLLKRY